MIFIPHLAEDPEWVLVQSDKTGQWIPMRICDYISDMKVHLDRYCSEIHCLQLDEIYRDTKALIEEVNNFCSDGESDFLRSWLKMTKIPSLRLSIKDHQPPQANGHYKMHLIVSAHNFTQCLS